MSDDRTSDNESSRRGRDQGTADELGWADKAADEELKAQSGRGSLGDDGSSHRGPPTLQVISSTPEVTSKPPATGEVELPHWTDPPTGEVPAVIAGEPPPGSDDLDDWAFASSSPRWRDEHTEDNAVDSFDDLAAEGEETMADDDSVEEFFEFDDLGSASGPSATTTTAPVAGERGSRRREPRSSGEPRPKVRQMKSGNGSTSGGAGRDVPTAAGVGLALLGIGFAAFWFANWTAVLLITVVLGLAAGEYLGALRRGGFAPATLPGLAAVGALSVGVYQYGTPTYGIVLSLTTLVGLLWFLTGVQRDQPVMNLGVTLLAVAHVGVLGSFGALIIREHPNDGAAIVFAGVLATVAYDVGAYFIGRSAGRTPLTSASPNKTVEGLVGGMGMTVLLSALLIGVADFGQFGGYGDKVWYAVLLGVVVSIAAPLGDLCESLIKRDLEVKDMGSLLPGHGGVMDRFDGMLFVLPALYYLSALLDLL